MKKQLLSVFAALTLSFSVSAQTTVTVTATGTAGSFNTGSVNSAGTKNDGNMVSISTASNAGWAKFDLTTIPAGAVVMSVNCAFTTYTTTSSTALNNLYGFVGDPAVIAGTTLYTNCTTGATFNNTSWTANAANTKTLNATGVNFIQTNITSNQLCIGFARASTNLYSIYGYPGTAGQQPMLVITYSVPAACSGAPTAGTATASNTLLCGPQNVNLNLSGSTAATGLTYQWLSSPDGISWSPIATATNIATTQSVTVPTYYQCAVACGTNVATSSTITVNFVGPNTYAAVPFLEAFDNTWQNRCDNQNVPLSANWSSNPTTGNSSWRRQDAGATATWSAATTATVAPIGTGCANFHSYYAPDKSVGDLDLYINMGTASNYEMSFYRFNTSGADSLEVWLSTNGGSTFTKKAGYNVATTWTKEVITLGAVGSSSCVVRFHGISDYGNDDLAFDSLKVYTAVCSTPPVAGIISGPTNVNNGSVNSYTISPATGNVQWYSAPSATGPYTAIGGANVASNQTITAVGSGTVYYGVVASNPGCLNDTSNVSLAVNVNFPGDNVCSAIPLPLGVTTTSYSVNGATTQTGEVVPPGTGFTTNTGWGNTNLSNSLWFTFVAPASGFVTVQSPDFDTQLAIWKAASCSDLLSAATATLVAANDDDANNVVNNGVTYSSFVTAACLTPGATYYIQLDSYDTPALAGSSTRVLVMDMGTALDASFTGLAANYCLPGATSSSLTPAVSGGVFTVNTSTTSVTSFSPASVGNYTVTYSILGCMTNSTTMVANTPTVMAMTSNTAICAGSSATLSAMGATNYTWTSGGNGMTEVVSPTGNATYTLTGEDSGCANTATVSVNVNALPAVMAMTSSTLVCSNFGESAILTASTAATSYTWSDGANTMTTTVTPTVGTTYTLTVNDGTCDATTTVFVDAQICMGINNTLVSTTGITVYPNPTNGILNITISSELAGNTSIEVYDAIGKLVIKETLSTETTTINTSKLTDGMYVYKVINNNKAIKIGKVVKH